MSVQSLEQSYESSGEIFIQQSQLELALQRHWGCEVEQKPPLQANAFFAKLEMYIYLEEDCFDSFASAGISEHQSCPTQNVFGKMAQEQLSIRYGRCDS